MPKFEIFECYEAFKNQCTCDKSYIRELYKRFRIEIIVCGQHLLEKGVLWSYLLPDDNTKEHHMEFLDFIDGNGFIIRQAEPDRYQIMPQYPQTGPNLGEIEVPF